MDLWIMGLLYMLIVCGSRLRGAFGGKGLVRSVCPTGEVCGRSPAFRGRRVWDKQEVGDKKKREEAAVAYSLVHIYSI